LPDISGFDVCRTIRGARHTSLIPVVHLSAEYVQSNHQVAGLNAGADAYMVHPVEPQLLIATLHALIRARLAEDGLRRSESRFRAIYDQAPAAMMLVSADGLISDANSQAQALLQRGIDDLAGSRWPALFRRPFGKKLRSNWQKTPKSPGAASSPSSRQTGRSA